MPYFSKQTADNDVDAGAFHEWTSQLADHTVNFVQLQQDVDLAPLLKGLPNDLCYCPHWGYMLKGSQTVRYEDGHEETFGPGDCFYMTPGHSPRASAGSEFVAFSPTDLLKVTEAVMQQNAQALQGA